MLALNGCKDRETFTTNQTIHSKITYSHSNHCRTRRQAPPCLPELLGGLLGCKCCRGHFAAWGFIIFFSRAPHRGAQHTQQHIIIYIYACVCDEMQPKSYATNEGGGAKTKSQPPKIKRLFVFCPSREASAEGGRESALRMAAIGASREGKREGGGREREQRTRHKQKANTPRAK